MYKYKETHILVWLLLLYSIGGYSQSTRNIHIGLGLTSTTYVGDFSEKNLSLQRFLPGGQVALRFDRGNRLWSQATIGTSRVVEQLDTGSLLSSSSDIFPNNFVDASLLHADFQVNVRFLRHKIIQPYIGTGLGFLFYEPKDENGNALGDNPFTRELGEEYSTISVYLPLTAGFLLKLGTKLSVGASYTFKPTSTDYIDNVGLLGPREGNDRLHSMQITVYYNLKRPKQPKLKPYQPLPDLNPILTSNENDGRASDQVDKQEKNWQAWEETSLLIRKFVYYTVEEDDNLDNICKQFHLRPEIVRQINFMSNNYVTKGMVLRLPDVGQSLNNK